MAFLPPLSKSELKCRVNKEWPKVGIPACLALDNRMFCLVLVEPKGLDCWFNEIKFSNDGSAVFSVCFSDPGPIIVLPCQSLGHSMPVVNFGQVVGFVTVLNRFSKLFHGFVKIAIWISLSC